MSTPEEPRRVDPATRASPGPHLPASPGFDAGSGMAGAARAGEPIERPGDSIGPYKLLERLGEGGFGTVWLAERRQPMVQRVAVKIIKPGMDSRSVVARFEQERQALAVMDHPSVAKVFDGGITPAGRPYFVMELVQGEPITEFCDRHHYTIRQRLELFVPVCEAVQHAHFKGIIHRDLKPSNILVSIRDGHATPKVIDFGVAKAISHTLTDKTVYTESGQLIGTPEYMSPEQAEMGSLDIDARTDVYSLGVVLYELLVGLPPFDGAALRSAGFDGLRRIIREQEAPKPSTRLSSIDQARASTISRARDADPLRLTGELRRELDWIPLKAMRKDRVRRYHTALDLAQDIQRYLAGQPLDAAPESRTYLASKFLKRNRGVAISGVSVVLALALGASGAVWGLVRARAAIERLEQEKAAALEDSRLQGLIGQAQFLRTTNDGAAFARQAAEGYDALCARSDRRTLRAWAIWADATQSAGRVDEAVPIFEQCFADRLRHLGPGDPWTIGICVELGNVLTANGQREAALERYQRGAELAREHAPPGDITRDGALQAYAERLRDAGRHAEAAEWFDALAQSLEARQPAPADHIQWAKDSARACRDAG